MDKRGRDKGVGERRKGRGKGGRRGRGKGPKGAERGEEEEEGAGGRGGGYCYPGRGGHVTGHGELRPHRHRNTRRPSLISRYCSPSLLQAAGRRKDLETAHALLFT